MGSRINRVLQGRFVKAIKAMEEVLGKVTIAELLAEFPPFDYAILERVK